MLGLAGLHLARALFNVGLVVLHLACGPFLIVAGVLFYFSLAALHLARDLFTLLCWPYI